MSDQEEVQAAFRAELSKRLRGSLGPNERVVLSLTRLPGLSTVEGARDSARILRAIASLLDAAGAPESMGQQFVDNLVAAAIGSVYDARSSPGAAQGLLTFSSRCRRGRRVSTTRNKFAARSSSTSTGRSPRTNQRLRERVCRPCSAAALGADQNFDRACRKAIAPGVSMTTRCWRIWAGVRS